MESTGDAPRRRRRRTPIGSETVRESTDGVSSGFSVPDEDLADTIVDINRLVEQKATGTDSPLPETSLNIYDKETRLRFIHKMRMRDLPKAEMCKRLGVSMGTLNSDIKELYSRLREGARKLDVNELIGDSIATYNEVLSMALNHASNVELPTPTRLAALRTVLSAKNDMHRFLNLAGFYDVAVYTKKETKTENDIGQLIKVTQAILNEDNTAENTQIPSALRAEVEHELDEIRLF
ncbi:MAG: hypothetical protein DRQ39_05880 [Gammaproteobacteria bacterium]|nr:MAG: hypothetical protein DRQ39_05880 [Gammaproteobacteria bacterium]